MSPGIGKGTRVLTSLRSQLRTSLGDYIVTVVGAANCQKSSTGGKIICFDLRGAQRGATLGAGNKITSLHMFILQASSLFVCA